MIFRWIDTDRVAPVAFCFCSYFLLVFSWCLFFASALDVPARLMVFLPSCFDISAHPCASYAFSRVAFSLFFFPPPRKSLGFFFVEWRVFFFSLFF